MKRRHITLFVFFLICLLALEGCALYKVTEYTDLEHYGQLDGIVELPLLPGGRRQVHRAEQIFGKLFPERIEPFFEDASYYYRAKDDGPYWEILLEFTISDKAVFTDYLQTLPSMEEFHPFPYDPTYLEYEPEDNWLWLDSYELEYDEEGSGTAYYWIDAARIQKILINAEEQHIVFAALWIEDDGGSTTDEIYFFRRFQIDPIDFLRVEGDGGVLPSCPLPTPQEDKGDG